MFTIAAYRIKGPSKRTRIVHVEHEVWSHARSLQVNNHIRWLHHIRVNSDLALSSRIGLTTLKQTLDQFSGAT